MPPVWGPGKTALNVLRQPPHHHTEKSRSWSMTIARRGAVALLVGMILMSALAASTKVQSQPSAYGRDAPSVFDGVLGNAVGSSEVRTAQLTPALTSTSVNIFDARP